jgi:hypothetical protein
MFGVSFIELQLNNAPNLNSVDLTKLLLSPLSAFSLTNFDVLLTGASTLRLSFPAVSAPGDYTFTALPGLFTDIFGQPLSQSYTGTFTVVLPVISGVITNASGQPVPGVLVQPSIGSPAVTDANGSYAIGAVPNQSIWITPSIDGLFFVPFARNYFNVTADLTNQNFLVVTTLLPSFSTQQQGTNLVMNWNSIPDVNYYVLFSYDLVQWNIYGEAMLGTGRPMQAVLPIESIPQGFFRLRASNY